MSAMAATNPTEVGPDLKKQLNAILKSTDALHSALFSGDELQIDSAIEKTLRVIGSTLLVSKKELHLTRILEAASSQLLVTRLKPVNKKHKHLKEVFRQIIQITRSYKTEKYRIFFCKKDKSVWLQKSWAAKNPFMPEGTKCGVLVR